MYLFHFSLFILEEKITSHETSMLPFLGSTDSPGEKGLTPYMTAEVILSKKIVAEQRRTDPRTWMRNAAILSSTIPRHRSHESFIGIYLGVKE
jgi:hypothetical protein